MKTFVFERHNETGKHGVGFVKGFHVKCGAMASTVCARRAQPARRRHERRGYGACCQHADRNAAAVSVIVQNGKVLGCVPLPFAGLMNPKSGRGDGRSLSRISARLGKQIGCDIQSPFMTMALIPLACLPELRLTDRGLVDCTTFSFADLEVE